MKIHMFSLKVVDSWPPSVNTCLAPFWIRAKRKQGGLNLSHTQWWTLWLDTLWLCEQHGLVFDRSTRLTNEKLLKSYAWFWITFISQHPRYSFMVKDKSHPPHFKELLKALSPIVEEHFGLIVPGQRPKQSCLIYKSSGDHGTVTRPQGHKALGPQRWI